MIPASDAEQTRLLDALRAAPGWARLCALRGDLDTSDVAAVLRAMGTLADTILAPCDAVADAQGCHMESGRVRVPDCYHGAWRAWSEGGWTGLDLSPEYGGSGLPIVVQAMTGVLADRAGIAFNMATGASRSAAILLAEYAPREVARDWVTALIAGERAATICMSEPQAGSDVGRIRTRAVAEGDHWRVTGQKCWISFGDHDLAPVIGHCLLARTGDAPGGRGLSLFFVPSVWDGAPNGIEVMGIEHKLGLHGSPTCQLAFGGAKAILLGVPERGLPQLFTMIEMMRLQVGGQGLGAAVRALDVAEAYGAERRQGGNPAEDPVPIDSHPDVRRQLAVMRGQAGLLRAAVIELALAMDLSRIDAEATDAAAWCAFLLPLVKAFGSETGFDCAHRGIQVLGGAGYTRDWPLERTLRDARVQSVYEGTTGMQGIDFLERRLVRDPAAFDAFARRATGPVGRAFVALGQDLAKAPLEARLAVADDWLRAGWLALAEWLGPRFAADEANALAQLPERFAVHAAAIQEGIGGT